MRWGWALTNLAKQSPQDSEGVDGLTPWGWPNARTVSQRGQPWRVSAGFFLDPHRWAVQRVLKRWPMRSGCVSLSPRSAEFSIYFWTMVARYGSGLFYPLKGRVGYAQSNDSAGSTIGFCSTRVGNHQKRRSFRLHCRSAERIDSTLEWRPHDGRGGPESAA